MAFKIAPTWALSVLILTFPLFPPFLHSSTSSLPHATNTNTAVNPPILTNPAAATFGSTVVASARQVPTGPDPLHHNGKPISP